MPGHGNGAVDLPIIDEHSRRIDAGLNDVWAGLGRMVAGMQGPSTKLTVRLVGARPAHTAGDPVRLRSGSAIPGFAIVRAESPRELVLEGHHRFSRYRLTFRLDSDAGATVVRAETRAVFPGITGRVYKAAVIGSHGHVVAVRRMLASIARETSRSAVS